MSVQTQIDRISGNVSAALSAIAEKGVTVPDGSNSDALAELIAAIEAGGGASGFATVATGEITLANSYANVRVLHELGTIPDVAILYLTGFNTSTTGIVASLLLKSKYQINAGRHNSSGYGAYIEKNSYTLDKTECSFNGHLQYGSGSTNYTGFKSGNTYKWIAGVYA